jgi:xylulokinase
VAYSVRHVVEHIERAGAEIEQIHCCGGQAASALWCQIKADVTGRRVIVPEVIEAPVLGAAIVAGVGVGWFENFSRGSGQMMRPRTALEPDPARHALYQEMYARYRELYTSVKPLYARV